MQGTHWKFILHLRPELGRLPSSVFYAKNLIMVNESEIKSRQRAIKTKKLVKYLVLALILVLAGFGLYKLLKSSDDTSGLKPGVFFEAQSRDHIAIGSPHPEYNSNPPTGGWHYDIPAQTGIYDKELPDEQLIHNLEHGHIWITYRPGAIDNESIEKLVSLAKKYGPKMIMTPRAKNPGPIAIAAWQYLITFDKVDDENLRVIDNFIRVYRGKAGPENPLDFGFGDFRGKEAPTLTPMGQ